MQTLLNMQWSKGSKCHQFRLIKQQGHCVYAFLPN
jgi:hypothetical protein